MIHKLIWILLVISYTLIEAIIIYGVFYTAYVIWNFSLFKENMWKLLHSYSEYEVNETTGDLEQIDIEDNNILDTIKRRL